MEKIEKEPIDFLLFLILILLAGLGVSVLFSASYYYAEKLTQDPYYFFRRQIIFIILGSIAAIIAVNTPLELWKRATPYFLLLSLLLTLLTLIPGVGLPVLGARRWLFIFGRSFQPSELVKFCLVLYLATLFSKKEERINDPLNSILPPLIVVSLFVTLIYLQNDFSTAFFILFIAIAMFFIARIKLRYFFFLGFIVLPLGVLLLFSKAHRVKRIIAFLNPALDPAGSGFQVIAARSALLNGGFWGRGLGSGVKKLGGLPEAHSDFIYAVIGEEMGFLGALFVLFLFILFAWRGYSISLKAGDNFIYYLSFGITSLIFVQSLMNIAVVTGLIPATGIPLPFFSSGGSSIVLTLVMSGLLLNLSRTTSAASAARRNRFV